MYKDALERATDKMWEAVHKNGWEAEDFTKWHFRIKVPLTTGLFAQFNFYPKTLKVSVVGNEKNTVGPVHIEVWIKEYLKANNLKQSNQ